MRMLFAVCLLLVSSLAAAAEGPMGGTSTWSRNAGLSQAPGEAPKSSVIDVTKDDGTNLAWSMTVVGQDGTSQTAGWSGAYDGKPRPVQGGGTAAFTKVAGNATKVVFAEDDGSTGEETCVLSAKRKRMTCKGVSKPKNAQSVSYLAVYDRIR